MSLKKEGFKLERGEQKHSVDLSPKSKLRSKQSSSEKVKGKESASVNSSGKKSNEKKAEVKHEISTRHTRSEDAHASVGKAKGTDKNAKQTVIGKRSHR